MSRLSGVPYGMNIARIIGRSFAVALVASVIRAEDSMNAQAQPSAGTETATFAGGCFWCVEAIFQSLDGIVKITPGYTGGHVKNPSYEQICSGGTGHAEAIRIEYDPSKVSFEELLDLFWQAHDPTQLNRQGSDIGTQYRSAIFYRGEAQKKSAEESIRKLAASGTYSGKIVTTLEPAGDFYEAEDYHRNYYRKNSDAPYCVFVIRPKMKKLGIE